MFSLKIEYLCPQVIGEETGVFPHTSVRTRLATWINIKTWNWWESFSMHPCQKVLSLWNAMRHIKKDLHVQFDRSILMGLFLKESCIRLWILHGICLAVWSRDPSGLTFCSSQGIFSRFDQGALILLSFPTIHTPILRDWSGSQVVLCHNFTGWVY